IDSRVGSWSVPRIRELIVEEDVERVAKKVWTRSGFPMPSGGFSVNSVWLNFYHLMSVSRKLPKENEARLAFPWILWQIWKARNSFCFEKWTKDAELIFSKASNEATMWLNMSLI
ncbi:unnamed protein product, partial [Brassica oleracea var. botrytis]